MRSQPKHHPRLIRRYGNRKLYDVQTSRYITLDGIRALVQAGEEVRVVDNDTNEDLTGVTFAQIIYEAERRGNGALSLPLLRWLIQRGDDAMRDFRRGVDRGREAFATVRAAAEKTFVRMETHDSRSLLGDLLEMPQRHLEDLQQRVRGSVDRVASHPTIRGELKRVERGLREIEKRLGEITKSASAIRRPVRARPQGAAKGRQQRPDRETSGRVGEARGL